MNTDSSFIDFLKTLCQGNDAAVEFLSLMTDLAHFWDDLIDRDPLPSDEAIQTALWSVMVDLPRNPFYQRYFAELNPVVACAILDWRVANRIESGAGDKVISFIIRSSYVCVLQQTALIIGGPDWAEEVGIMLRAKAHTEGYAAYVKTLGEPNGTL